MSRRSEKIKKQPSMKYMGSKARIAKDILPIMLKHRRPDQYWVEPFVGGANMIDKVTGPRIGSDINPYLIAMFKALQNGWDPPKELTEAQYHDIKNNKHLFDPALVGYVGFALSFGGKWFGGWRRDNKNTDQAAQALRSIEKQALFLKGIYFENVNYFELAIPPKSIIYCDPPYLNTTQYRNKFDHEKFYEWAYNKALEGHTIFISEYFMPKEFDCIWQKEISSSLTKDTGSKTGVEKLYTIL